MNGSYTKLFSSLVTSTVWMEDSDTRVVWVTMLALADQHGEVAGSVPGLARISGVSVEACERALQKFLSPDPYSRSKNDAGCRIEEIDGGWHLLNYAEYRQRTSKEEKVERERERKRRYRARTAHGVPNVPPVSRPCPAEETVGDENPLEAEAEAEADKKKEYRPPAGGLVACATDGDAERGFALFNDAAKRTGWPAVQKLDPDRKKLMRARLNDVGGLEGFAIAIGKAEASEFLTTGWPNFNLDWMLKPKNFRKLMEGNYDNRDRGVGGQATGAVRSTRGDDAFYDQLAIIARRP